MQCFELVVANCHFRNYQEIGSPIDPVLPRSNSKDEVVASGTRDESGFIYRPILGTNCHLMRSQIASISRLASGSADDDPLKLAEKAPRYPPFSDVLDGQLGSFHIVSDLALFVGHLAVFEESASSTSWNVA